MEKLIEQRRISIHELSPGIKSDEALKSSLTANHARAANATFISQDELSPPHSVFQNRLNKNFYYPTENTPPKSKKVNGETIFSYSKGQKAHDEFLRSGAVSGTIVARQEEPTIGGVVDYAKWRLGGPEKVLVMIAPAPKGEEEDQSYDIARKSGVLTLRQERVMECIDQRQTEKKLGIPYPFPEGKGMTMMSANIVRFLVEPQKLPKPNEVQLLGVIDADLHNPSGFDVWGFIGEAAYHDTQERLQYRAARGGRNNETVKAGINLLSMYDNPKINYFYRELSRDQWVLTGQHMNHPIAEWHRFQPSGYSLEVGTNMHQVDLMRDKIKNPRGLDRAQVTIPTNCLDAGNDAAKEQGMMYLANTFIHTVAQHIKKTEKWIGDFSITDYKKLNQALQKHSGYVYIPQEPGPNKLVQAKMDYIWAPLPMLVDEGIIIPKEIKKLKSEIDQR